MGRPVSFDDGIACAATAYFKGNPPFSPPLPRSALAQDNLAVYSIPHTAWVVWNTGQPLPAAGANDDLGLVIGAFATGSPTLQTQDHQNAGAAQLNYARLQLWLPAEYVDGQTVIMRLHSGMLTNVADQAASIDLQAYLSDGEGGIGSDICDTAAITTAFNNVTLDDHDFVITPATLVAGSMLDVRVATSVDDDATGAAVIAKIGATYLLCDVKG